MSMKKPVLGTMSVFTERDSRNAEMYRDNQRKPSYYFGDVVYIATHCSLKAYCAILVRLSRSHQASPHASPRDSTQRRKVELWARNFR